MRSSIVLVASLVALFTIACGGSQREPNTPAAETAHDGSSTPDLTPASSIGSPPEAASPTAKTSSTDDGSDIMPPGIGPSAKDAPAKEPKKPPKAGKKKGAGRSKKKG